MAPQAARGLKSPQAAGRDRVPGGGEGEETVPARQRLVFPPAIGRREVCSSPQAARSEGFGFVGLGLGFFWVGGNNSVERARGWQCLQNPSLPLGPEFQLPRTGPAAGPGDAAASPWGEGKAGISASPNELNAPSRRGGVGVK